jgi:hypothetical protein
MRLIQCCTIEQLHGVGIQHAGYWTGVTEASKHKRTNTSFIVSCMRLFGLCSARVPLEASLTSKKRFETFVIAPKINLERIAVLHMHARSSVLNDLVCSNSPIALAMP